MARILHGPITLNYDDVGMKLPATGPTDRRPTAIASQMEFCHIFEPLGPCVWLFTNIMLHLKTSAAVAYWSTGPKILAFEAYMFPPNCEWWGARCSRGGGVGGGGCSSSGNGQRQQQIDSILTTWSKRTIEPILVVMPYDLTMSFCTTVNHSYPFRWLPRGLESNQKGITSRYGIVL